jgi:DNA-directed RNA polymerase specialized sigma24 family protein
VTAPDEAGRERIVLTALARFHAPRGFAREDLAQTAWLALLEAERTYDPARHRCRREAYLVVKVRARLSRLCRRAAREAASLEFPEGLESRGLEPAEDAIAREEVRRGRQGRRRARPP